MSNKVHNKKRNIGLLWEFLTRAAAAALVEGDSEKSAAVLRVIKRHFSPGTHLYNEFRLFDSLMKVEVSSPAVAASILSAAREAAKSYDVNEISKAKTRLINEMNKVIDDPHAWDVEIPNYRTYATIGTLISEWRQPTGKADIELLAQYEERLVNWLSEKKQEAAPLVESNRDGTENIALRIALKKFNEKYSALLPEQKQLIKSWVLSKSSGDASVIRSQLESIKKNTGASISRALVERGLSTINSDLKIAEQKLLSESLNAIDDETIKRFMLYTKLDSEIRTTEDEENER